MSETTNRVTGYANGAAIAAQLNKVTTLEQDLANKANKDGYYGSMRVGSADNLTSKGTVATDQLITSRAVGGDTQVEEGDALITYIKGNTIVMNQYADGDFTKGSFTSNEHMYILGDHTFDSGYALFPTTTSAWKSGTRIDKIDAYGTVFAPISGHKYLHIIEAKSDESAIVQFTTFGTSNKITLTNTFNKYYCILEYSSSASLYVQTPSATGSWCLKYEEVIDLTQMFGSGNEPKTVESFAKMLGYDSIDDVPYFDYNEGELLSMNAVGIKTSWTEDGTTVTKERSWASTINTYFADGLKSAGSAYDEITATKAVKRIGKVDLGTLEWKIVNESEESGPLFRTTGITDKKNGIEAGILCLKYKHSSSPAYVMGSGFMQGGEDSVSFFIRDLSFAGETASSFKAAMSGVYLYYELATPEEYTYDELNLNEQVVEGATEEYILEDGETSSPLRIDVKYPIDAFNTILANKTNIGTMSELKTEESGTLVGAVNEVKDEVESLAIQDGSSLLHIITEAEAEEWNEEYGSEHYVAGDSLLTITASTPTRYIKWSDTEHTLHIEQDEASLNELSIYALKTTMLCIDELSMIGSLISPSTDKNVLYSIQDGVLVCGEITEPESEDEETE